MSKGENMTPYFEALAFIRNHPGGTGGTTGLSKLILSLWNEECCYSYRECVRALDDQNRDLAIRIIQHFHAVGEDRELVEIGHEIIRTYPRLWDITEAQIEARRTLEDRWEQQREEEAEEAENVRLKKQREEACNVK
jgi:hypothetical protein